MEKQISTNNQKTKININSYNTSRPQELWGLNVIRGISALLIVLYHYTTQYESSIGHIGSYPVKVPWGCYAVYTFFALSGFLTIYTYRKGISSFKFLKKRFFRLYPIFWVCIFVTTLYMAIIFPERVRSIKDILLNLTMVPSILGGQAVDGVYWTLAKELMFYIAFAILIKFDLVSKLKKLKWVWLIVAAIAAFYCIGPFDLPAQSIVSFFLIPDYIQAFLAGIAVYYICYGKQTKILYIESSVFLVLSVIYTYAVRSADVAIFFAIMLIALLIGANSNLNKKNIPIICKPFLFIAEISYVLYLTHQFTGFGIIRIIENAGLTNEFWIIIPIIHAIVLAVVLHYFIEIPLNRKLKKFA